MSQPALNALRSEYNDLFDTCVVRPERESEVNSIVKTISTNKGRYEDISKASSVPWYMIGAIHSLEGSLDFGTHLHNGDSLKRKTVNVPAGRPPGQPPFTFEGSAIDALKLDRMSIGLDGSLAGILFKLEGFNGFSSRKKQINTPYLWSFSNHYTSGKFVADGFFSATAVSKQCGAAVILRRLAELGTISFDRDQPPVNPEDPPMVRFANTKSNDPEIVERARNLQRFLNIHPGIFVKVDGVPGTLTSDAFKKVTGNFLTGDPRA